MHDLVDVVWAHQSVWSQTANRLKARSDRLRLLMLALAVASAILTTSAAQLANLDSTLGATLSLSAGIAVGLVPLVRTRLGRDSVSRWTRARSVAEELKSEVYPFLAGVAPYRGPDREAVLAERSKRVQDEADDLIVDTAGVTALARETPDVSDPESYVRLRLLPQIDWYRSRSADLSTKLVRARRAEVGLGVTGVVLAAAAARLASDAAAAWVAVVTTVTAAVSSHVAASRWEYQLVEYLRTAKELSRLYEAWIAIEAPPETVADELVSRSEQVMSIQNEGWMAKWTAER